MRTSVEWLWTSFILERKVDFIIYNYYIYYSINTILLVIDY